VLKSGCKIDELDHHSIERLERAIAIRLVIAWRVILMTLLSREAPELPPERLFPDIELRVVITRIYNHPGLVLLLNVFAHIIRANQ
jgi:hypothetical protein